MVLISFRRIEIVCYGDIENILSAVKLQCLMVMKCMIIYYTQCFKERIPNNFQFFRFFQTSDNTYVGIGDSNVYNFLYF